MKRLQDELQEEIVPLKEKIKAELQPQHRPAVSNRRPQIAQRARGGDCPLEGWAEAAGEKMSRRPDNSVTGTRSTASEAQQAAIDELEKIWEAVIPFHPLLARDLADQTRIAAIARTRSCS